MDSPQQVKKRRFLWVLVACSLAIVVGQLDVSIVNVALVHIGNSLGGNMVELQWVLDAYTVVFAALLLSAGAFGDRIGIKQALIVGFVIFTIASLLCGVAPTTGLLIAARALQGIGGALLIPCSLAVINYASANDRKARLNAVALWSAGGAAALALGPILGGMMIARLGWPSIFLINVPLGALGIWMCYQFIDEIKPAAPRPFDIVGQVTMILALFALTFGVIESGLAGWGDRLVWGAIICAIVMLVIFIFNELMVTSPLLPLTFFKNKVFSTTVTLGFAINFVFYSFMFSLSFYFQSVKLYSSFTTGLAFLPIMVFLFLANMMCGRLGARFGVKRIMMIGLCIAFIGVLVLVGLSAHGSYWSSSFWLMLVCLGFGTTIPLMTSSLLSSVPIEWGGRASGVLNASRQSGGAIGIALCGALMNADILKGIHHFFLLAALILLALLPLVYYGIREAA